MRVFAGVRTSRASAYTNADIPDYDNWTHYAAVLRYTNKPAGYIQLYKNGALLYQAPISDIDNNCDLSSLTTTFGIANGSIYAGNGPSFVPSVWVSDVRVYNEALSDKEIYDISKALSLYVPFFWQEGYTQKNLIVNSFAQCGQNGWTVPPDTTDIPTGSEEYIRGSWSLNATQTSDYLIPIIKNHTYKLSVTFKQYKDSTSTSYPALRAWDYDKKEILHYMTAEGFHSSARTTLAKDLNPGDTVIYATDLSNWTTDTTTHYYYCAVFGYKDSSGRVYDDFTYTQDSLRFGYQTDKSNINKQNNTIQLLQAYTGEPRSAGTTICQSAAGSTWYYPWGGINPTTLTVWVSKSVNVAPFQIERLKNAYYISYVAQYNLYHAGITLQDMTDMRNIARLYVKDNSGFNNNLFI